MNLLILLLAWMGIQNPWFHGPECVPSATHWYAERGEVWTPVDVGAPGRCGTAIELTGSEEENWRASLYQDVGVPPEWAEGVTVSFWRKAGARPLADLDVLVAVQFVCPLAECVVPFVWGDGFGFDDDFPHWRREGFTSSLYGYGDWPLRIVLEAGEQYGYPGSTVYFTGFELVWNE